MRKKTMIKNAHNTIALPDAELYQNELAHQMTSWVIKNYESVDLEDFPLLMNMSPTAFYALADVNTFFKHNLDRCRYIMASRIKKQSKTLPKHIFEFYMRQYDEQYRQDKLQKLYVSERARQDAIVAVTMNEIPSSDKVPKRVINAKAE